MPKTVSRNRIVSKSTAGLSGTGTVTSVSNSDGTVTVSGGTTAAVLSVQCCTKNIRIPLSAAQIKTGNSVPISAIVPSGGSKIIAIMGAQIVLTAGVTPFDISPIGLSTVDGKLGRFQGVNINSSTNVSGVFSSTSGLSPAPTTLAGKTIFVQTDVDSSTSGNSTAVVYIQYLEISQ